MLSPSPGKCLKSTKNSLSQLSFWRYASSSTGERADSTEREFIGGAKVEMLGKILGSKLRLGLAAQPLP